MAKCFSPMEKKVSGKETPKIKPLKTQLETLNKSKVSENTIPSKCHEAEKRETENL